MELIQIIPRSRAGAGEELVKISFSILKDASAIYANLYFSEEFLKSNNLGNEDRIFIYHVKGESNKLVIKPAHNIKENSYKLVNKSKGAKFSKVQFKWMTDVPPEDKRKLHTAKFEKLEDGVLINLWQG